LFGSPSKADETTEHVDRGNETCNSTANDHHHDNENHTEQAKGPQHHNIMQNGNHEEHSMKEEHNLKKKEVVNEKEKAVEEKAMETKQTKQQETTSVKTIESKTVHSSSSAAASCESSDDALCPVCFEPLRASISNDNNNNNGNLERKGESNYNTSAEKEKKRSLEQSSCPSVHPHRDIDAKRYQVKNVISNVQRDESEDENESTDADGIVCCLGACGHRFHKDCIVQWAKLSALCPLCKAQFNYIKV